MLLFTNIDERFDIVKYKQGWYDFVMSTLAENKRAGISYDIMETYEAGISLLGFEAKAARAGRADLRGALVKIDNGQAFLAGASISPYQQGNTPREYTAKRRRRLLLKSSEIQRLVGKVSQKGLTLLPLSLYTKKQWIKLKFALVKPLKKFDKREKIKEREFKRREAKLEGRKEGKLIRKITT